MMRIAVWLLALSITLTAWAKSEGDTRAAKRLFNSGMAHFNLQEYQPAIDDFEAAYRALPDPSFLYNLAQAHRLAHNRERAIYFYRIYLHAAPNAANRDEVEHRLAELQAPPPSATQPAESPPAAATVEQPAAASTPASTHETSANVVVSPPPNEQHPAKRKRWWIPVTVIGVVAAAGLGVGLGVGLTRPHDNTYPGLSF
jgi:tetratricopeptide (TPR) repeat protein